MNKPSRHIDEAIELIDRMFPVENERNKFCWKCNDVSPDPKSRAGLCKQCAEKLKPRKSKDD